VGVGAGVDGGSTRRGGGVGGSGGEREGMGGGAGAAGKPKNTPKPNPIPTNPKHPHTPTPPQPSKKKKAICYFMAKHPFYGVAMIVSDHKKKKNRKIACASQIRVKVMPSVGRCLIVRISWFCLCT